jgi:hypothetical protein
MRKIILFLAVALAVSSPCYAQFSGPSFFSSAPSSQLGPVTNNLILTDTANGFVVSGQLIVNVPATSTTIGGLVASWTVDRPLQFPYGPNNLTTTTLLSGFSAPPPGAVGNTNGSVQSIYTDYLGTTTSLSLIPMQLVAGVDSPPWISLSNTSAVFSHTATPGQFLRQTFFLDGQYFNGPGGSWTIDVPVTSSVNAVPEPPSIAMGVVVLFALLGYTAVKRRQLRCPAGFPDAAYSPLRSQ